jgi:hypothetical protein
VYKKELTSKKKLAELRTIFEVNNLCETENLPQPLDVIDIVQLSAQTQEIIINSKA